MNLRKIKRILNKENISYQSNVSLLNKNSFRLNSLAKIYIEINSKSELLKVLKVLKEYNFNYFILGRGSNILLTKKIYKMIFIKLNFKDSIYRYRNNVLVCGNCLNSTLSSFLMMNGLGGFEFASCIPGSIAGGVYMNASYKDKSFSDIVRYVEIIDENLNVRWLSNKEMNFTYRSSIVKSKKYVICRVIFAFYEEEKKAIKDKILLLQNNKLLTQPIDEFSAGCVFKNNIFKAYKCIIGVGLVNKEINGALFSNKHANFIVNRNNASGKSILKLIKLAKKKVLKKYKIILEEEIEIL